MTKYRILGIDPGVEGGIALYEPDRPSQIIACDIPTAAGEIDAAELARLIKSLDPTTAIIESVHAMPKQGVSSTFRFGMAYGSLRATVSVLGIPTHLVTPQRWKKDYGLPAEKEQARALAIRLWPDSNSFARKRDHGRAEAALIARFGTKLVS